MNPEDRVLVGVINRKRDLTYAREGHWYRIPQMRMPQGVHADYLAFFLSGKVFKAQSGGIHYFARITGLELTYRRDLLPHEADHRRGDNAYYRVALDELMPKVPPILNPSRRVITFIYTTWDRFVHATQISDLYSEADYLVDRVYHALRTRGIHSERIWEAEKSIYDFAPGLRVLCEAGTLDASTQPGQGTLYLDESQPEDKILAAIRAAIEQRGGPVTINIPLEGS
jgi:hypothetical protein